MIFTLGVEEEFMLDKEIESIESYFNQCASNYDQYNLNDLGKKEFYDEIERQMLSLKSPKHILVLGCGTGLEIERINQTATVTALDVSSEMLKKLKQKTFRDSIKLRTIHNSFLNVIFTNEKFDLVLSAFSLHYFNQEQKNKLYQNIYRWLKPTGCFINCDSIAKDKTLELIMQKEAESIYQSNKLTYGTLHIDTPMNLESEQDLLKQASFSEISIQRRWTNSVLLKAEKMRRRSNEEAEERTESEDKTESEDNETFV